MVMKLESSTEKLLKLQILPNYTVSVKTCIPCLAWLTQTGLDSIDYNNEQTHFALKRPNIFENKGLQLLSSEMTLVGAGPVLRNSRQGTHQMKVQGLARI